MKEKAKKIFRSILKNKKIVLFFVLFLIVGVFSVKTPVYAEDVIGAAGNTVSAAVNTILAWIIYPFVTLVGTLLTLIIFILVQVCQYNNFINAAPVVTGWVIVRDICNMFFILILLVIAFSTILRVDGYDVKKMVPKLIIMAILINFSKTICGLILDAANIVMNTFVNAFKDIGDQGFVAMFGLPNLLKFAKETTDDTTGKQSGVQNVAGSLILALAFSLVALVVTVVLLAVLVVRMVMIWIYIVLSPLAYLLSSFPQGKKYASQWWDDFTKNVISGPILAFFIWLAFTTLNSNDVPISSVGAPSAVGGTQFGTPDTMLKFIISIGMLMGGLIITQQAGGAIGKIAGNGMAKIQGGTSFVRKKSAAVGAAVGAKAWSGTKSVVGAGNRLAGVGIASMMKPDSKLRATASSGVGALAMAGLRAPGKIIKSAKEKVLGENRINNARHEHFMKVQAALSETDPVKRDALLKQAKITADDQKWAYNDTKNVFENDKGDVLKDKFGREVKAMGAAEAAIHQSFGAASSKSRVAADKVREEKVTAAEKDLKMLDVGQVQAVMENKGASSVQRMAAAKVLAEGGNLRNRKDADLAKELTAGLAPIFEKVEDAIDKKQTHLNYDFEAKDKNGNVDTAKRNGEVNRFKKRVDKDKVDLTKLPEDAIKNIDLMTAAKEHRGPEFWNDIESAHKKGGEKVRAALEDTLSKMGDNFGAAAAAETDPVKKRGLEADSDKARITKASLSGNMEESFVDKKTGKVHTGAMESFFRNGTPSEISKINAFAMNDFMTAHATEAHDLLSKPGVLSQGKLKSIYKKGENNDLVALLVDRIIRLGAHPEVQKIRNDNDLGGLNSVI